MFEGIRDVADQPRRLIDVQNAGESFEFFGTRNNAPGLELADDGAREACAFGQVLLPKLQVPTTELQVQHGMNSFFRSSICRTLGAGRNLGVRGSLHPAG